MNMMEARQRLRGAQTPEEQVALIEELRAEREKEHGNATGTVSEDGA